MATTIRLATSADVPQILTFIRALASYEREPDAVTATEADLLRDGFGPNPFYFCLIAESDGKALLKRVAAIAVENGCPRLQWEVLDWNTPAIKFYEATGAEFMDTWRNVRVTGEALLKLAGATEETAL